MFAQMKILRDFCICNLTFLLSQSKPLIQRPLLTNSEENSASRTAVPAFLRSLLVNHSKKVPSHMSMPEQTAPSDIRSASSSNQNERGHHHAHHSSREKKTFISQGDNRRLRYRHGFGRWDYIIPIFAFAILFLAFAALYFFI